MPPSLAGPLLALDTTHSPLSVALLLPDGRIVEQQSDERAGTVLHGMVEALLASEGLGPRDLGGLAVLRGPGSFTGLRVGLAAAAGFVLAARVPALGLETTRVLALASGRTGRVAALVEGGQGRVFAGLHDVDGQGAEPLSAEPMDATVDEALALIAQADFAVLRGTCPGRDRLLAAGCEVFESATASAAARLALGKLAEPASLQALYARAPAIRCPAPR